jgi:phage terminase large subunit-like protein
MFLLDLEAANGVNLKGDWLHEYPASEINPSRPVIFGIDYASTADKARDKDRDYFTLAIGRAIPGGGLVLVDGVRARVSKGEALDTTIGYWAVYPTLKRIGVEKIGKGEEFYNDLLLLRDLNGKVPPLMPITHGRRSKGERFENWLAPRFQAARVWISDAATPFLREFRNEWLTWPNATHDDCLDGVYMMAAAGEGFMPGKAERTITGEKKKAENPLFAFGRT